MVLVTVLSILLLFAFATRSQSRTYRHLSGAALVGHVLLALFVIPALPYQWDITTFHTAASQVASGSLPSNSVSVNAFGAFQGFLYVIFGDGPTTLSLINGLLAVLIPIPMFSLSRRLYLSAIDSTDGVAALALFAPLPFLFLTLPMRDTLSVLLLFVTLVLVTNVVTRARYWHGLAVIPLVGCLLLLRTELALLLLVGSIAAGIVSVLDTVARHKISFVTLMLAVLPTGVVGFLLFTHEFPLASLNDILTSRASGSAVYLDGVTYDSWTDVLLLAPVRALFFQFAPFPLHVNSPFDLLAILELPLLVVLTVAAYRSLAACETNESVLALLLTVYLGGIVGYGLIDSNFGTTVRHRIPFMFLLVVFASPVLERRRRSLRRWFGERQRDDDH
ncbi:hypothetical protein M0R88_04095 [Halorussus gelatinilyticus]|uniref:Uncharacterized protein n=1 Tax=Halorussus gelatinilyticus TaxID=2937524 RepID=A0A8U0IKZ1_9EURY|nr:hypothetical protein [Halorussus gelatinilyticus]UPW01291.1 hypothetical protein M0R88_04095 [Halorussus gelatinilyticus]